jgi:hypothetical protein
MSFHTLLLLCAFFNNANCLLSTTLVSFSATQVSLPIAPNYVSFSMEIDDALHYLGNATHPSAAWVRLMGLLQGLSGGPGPTLRIGGDSADYSVWWDPPPIPGPLPRSQRYAITRIDLEAYAALVPQWRGKVALDTTLFFPNNATFAVAHIGGVKSFLGFDLVEAIEVGNEPEGYNGGEGFRPHNWSPLDYSREFLEHVTAMEAAGMPKRFIQGAVLGGNDKAFNAAWANYTSTFGSLGILKSVSRHFYSLDNCGGAGSTVWDLLNATQSTVAFLEPFAASAAAAGVPFVVGEGNSASCGGVKGTSDVFGASLWALDTLLSLAMLNTTMYNMHGGPHNAYSPIQTRVPSLDPIVMPVFYGMWAAAAASANGSALLAVSVNAPSPLVNAFALQETGGGGRVRVVVIHKDFRAPSTQVVVTPPSSLATPSATLVRLLGGGVSEQTNISFGGLSFSGVRDGTPRGTPVEERVALVGGAFTLLVPSGSACILTLSAQ